MRLKRSRQNAKTATARSHSRLGKRLIAFGVLPSRDGNGAVNAILSAVLFQQRASVLKRKCNEEFVMWGGPPGPRPTPISASFCVMAEPDLRVRRGRGRLPHCGMRL